MPWQPLNKYCWDFWFVFSKETLHVFYLQANQLACGYIAERRHNLSSVGHAVLTDFGWQDLPIHPPYQDGRDTGTMFQFGREASLPHQVATICSIRRCSKDHSC